MSAQLNGPSVGNSTQLVIQAINHCLDATKDNANMFYFYYHTMSKTMYTIQPQVLLCPTTHKTVIHLYNNALEARVSTRRLIEPDFLMHSITFTKNTDYEQPHF